MDLRVCLTVSISKRGRSCANLSSDRYFVCLGQDLSYRPDRPNRRGPVPVYRSGLAGNRSVPVEFKIEFKNLRSTGSYRYTGRLDRFTGRFDRFTDRFDRFEFKSKFKIACVTGLERYTGRFDRFTKWALMGRLIFSFSFLV